MTNYTYWQKMENLYKKYREAEDKANYIESEHIYDKIVECEKVGKIFEVFDSEHYESMRTLVDVKYDEELECLENSTISSVTVDNEEWILEKERWNNDCITYEIICYNKQGMPYDFLNFATFEEAKDKMEELILDAFHKNIKKRA